MTKYKTISFRIEEQFFDDFEKYCDDNFTTKSSVCYKFVRQTLKHSGKRISLEEYKERRI